MKTDPAPLAKIAGERAVAARKAAGVTQKVMAELIGVDQTAISRLEIGNFVHPPLDTIGRYCQIVGCDPMTIIGHYFTLDQLIARKDRKRRRPLQQVAS